MDTHLAALAADFLTHAVDDAVGVGGELAELGVAWEGIHVLEAHAEAPLAVDAYQQGHTGILLEAACHGSLTLGGAGEEAEAAHAVAVHALGEFLILIVVHIERHTDDHKLGDALLERQLLHHRVDPSFLCTAEMEAACREAL